MASVERYKPLPSRTNRKLRVTSSFFRRSLFHGASMKALLLKALPRRALEMEHISLWELYEGNLEGELFDWGPRMICQVTLWKWASVSIGTPLQGTSGGRSFPTAFERGVKFLIYQENFY